MDADKLDCLGRQLTASAGQTSGRRRELIREFCKRDVTLYTVSPFKLVVLGAKVGDSLAETQ